MFCLSKKLKNKSLACTKNDTKEKDSCLFVQCSKVEAPI
jgi:hypothetical protein